MKLCLFFVFYFFLVNIVISNGQPFENVLKVGDKVPDVALNQMLNYKSKKSTLSDFRGRVVILDFWSKYCSACINAFPKMGQLQDEFGDKLQILLTTKNNIEDLSYLFKHSPNVINNKLPIILNDTILHKLFPHNGEPYLVWLDGEGRVLATTGSDEATSENVKAILSGQRGKLTMREDEVGFNKKVPLMLEGNGRQWKHLQYYSMIMNWVDGNPGSSGGGIIDPISRQRRDGISLYNLPIIGLYQIAYNEHNNDGKLVPVIVETEHSEQFYEPFPLDDTAKKKEWKLENLYNYELVLPPEKESQKLLFMQQDLERFFGLKGIIEERWINCLILFRIDSEEKMKTKGGEPIAEKTKDGWFFRNVSLAEVSSKLMSKYVYTGKFPVYKDSTGYHGNVDIEIGAGLEDLSTLSNELSKYGLGIKEREEMVKCLIIKNTD